MIIFMLMKTKTLGKTNIQVAPLAFGGNVLGWTIDENRSFEVLDGFTGAGFNLIDTADVYARWATGIGGESETILGKWMKARQNRSKVVIATKAGMDMGQGKVDVSKAYILKAAEASLRRLQTDYIDLYQTHKDDETVPVEGALEAYAQLIKEGKVRYIGASNFSPARLSAALKASDMQGLPRYQTLQPLYNLYEREGFEKTLEPLCLEEHVSVIGYFSLGSGFLTGKYRSENDLSKSIRGDRSKMYLNERGFRILAALDEVAARHNTAQASVALAWLMARPSVAAPIASATSLEQMKELTDATTLDLSASDMTLLNEASRW